MTLQISLSDRHPQKPYLSNLHKPNFQLSRKIPLKMMKMTLLERPLFSEQEAHSNNLLNFSNGLILPLECSIRARLRLKWHLSPNKSFRNLRQSMLIRPSNWATPSWPTSTGSVSSVIVTNSTYPSKPPRLNPHPPLPICSRLRGEAWSPLWVLRSWQPRRTTFCLEWNSVKKMNSKCNSHNCQTSSHQRHKLNISWECRRSSRGT